MTQTFFFYDLETSGLSARQDRIMQFAGQRADMSLQPIGEPYNVLIRLNDDTLPNPEALMVTGITPQKTVEEGYSEVEFARLLMDQVFTPGTIAVGFNNVRFDDEFIRHLLWRNFYDPYEWAWKDGRSRWDLLDVVRMTRALRPEGIKWPVDDVGEPTNRLELITKVNNISHDQAHDALSDVTALIAVAKLIKDVQPQLFAYLLKMRGKSAVQRLVNLEERIPFVYTSGRYDKEWNKTSVVLPIASVTGGAVLVYDLRYSPIEFVDLSEDALIDRLFATWEQRQANDFVKLPVKTLQYNRCPAVAPLGVLEQADGWEKIGLTSQIIEENRKALYRHPEFITRLRDVFNKKRDFPSATDPESRLYDGFLNDQDRRYVEAVRNATERELAGFQPEFKDERLSELLLHYKARNYPKTLSVSEQAAWEEWRIARLKSQLPQFIASLQKSMKAPENVFMTQELQLWLENILPTSD